VAWQFAPSLLIDGSAEINNIAKLIEVLADFDTVALAAKTYV